MRTPRHGTTARGNFWSAARQTPTPGGGPGGPTSASPERASEASRSSFTKTNVGNGFLRENSNNLFAAWDVRLSSKSALKRCMYLPLPAGFQQFLEEASDRIGPSSPLPAPPPRPVQQPVVHRRNPAHDARIFASPDFRSTPPSPVAQQGWARPVRREGVAAAPPRLWWEDPVVVGSLLLVAPPIGLAALWSSKRYGSEARLALTVMTGLMMCLVTAIAVALTLR